MTRAVAALSSLSVAAQRHPCPSVFKDSRPATTFLRHGRVKSSAAQLKVYGRGAVWRESRAFRNSCAPWIRGVNHRDTEKTQRKYKEEKRSFFSVLALQEQRDHRRI